MSENKNSMQGFDEMEKKEISVEEKQQILKDLIETGKQNGKLSHKELMNVAAELEMDSD